MISFQPDLAPWEEPEPHPLERAYNEDRAAVTACAARPEGHRWNVVGQPEEEPYLACQDCPADGDDLFPDIHDELSFDDEGRVQIGDRVVVFGRELPADVEPFELPVHVEVVMTYHQHAEGTDYDVEITITPREAGA